MSTKDPETHSQGMNVRIRIRRPSRRTKPTAANPHPRGTLSFEEAGLLEAMAESRTLPELTDQLAGPTELGEDGWITHAYAKRRCAMQRRAWRAVCRLLRAGLIRECEHDVFDPPRWEATR
jgi:hypothetical protein